MVPSQGCSHPELIGPAADFAIAFFSLYILLLLTSNIQGRFFKFHFGNSALPATVASHGILAWQRCIHDSMLVVELCRLKISSHENSLIFMRSPALVFSCIFSGNMIYHICYGHLRKLQVAFSCCTSSVPQICLFRDYSSQMDCRVTRNTIIRIRRNLAPAEMSLTR
jgi:hypothetical protein